MNAPAHSRDGWPLEQGFQLGELRIDPRAGEVTGAGGAEKLDPKVMDVLVVLAGHAGQVVLREDLLTRLWPNAVVTDDVLSRCIYELRRQLALAGGDEQFKAMLETVPKRGYRLNGEISPLARSTGRPPARRSTWPLLAGAAAASVAVVAGLTWFITREPADAPPAGEVASIVVLPFVDMSAAQDQAYFSDGVTEEILNRLSQARSLRVIDRTSAFAFRGKTSSISEIAAKLDVTHALEGSVRRSGDHIRITARLVEASTNSQLWSETYDRQSGDLFAIQDELATAVAGALRTRLEGVAPDSPASREALDLFLRGQFLYNRRAPGDIAQAVKYYQEALAIEPDYARPWAGLAGAYSLLAYDGEMSREDALEKQGEAARKAVELDPNLAVGLARYSQYHWDIGDRKTAYEIFERAVALDPDDLLVLNFSAGLAMRGGDAKSAIEFTRRIVARDPVSASHRVALGMYLQAAGQLEAARSELLRAKEFNPELGSPLDIAIARILVLQGRLEDARRVIAGLPPGEHRDHGFALLLHAEGRRVEADEVLERLVERSAGTPDIRLAEVFAWRGMVEQAFAALAGLQEAIDRNEPRFSSQIWSWQLELRVSPFLKPLYADPRWQPLLIEPPSPVKS